MTMVMDLLAAQAGVTEVGTRVGWWVARMPVKEAADRFGADVRTVKSWRQGCMPSHRHLLAMVRLWGRPFLDHVFAPVLCSSSKVITRLSCGFHGPPPRSRRSRTNCGMTSLWRRVASAAARLHLWLAERHIAMARRWRSRSARRS